MVIEIGISIQITYTGNLYIAGNPMMIYSKTNLFNRVKYIAILAMLAGSLL